MSLKTEIESVRDRYLAELTRAHDYYAHTKVAWEVVRIEVEKGLNFTVQNVLTNSSVSESELLTLSRQYTTRDLTSATLQQFVSIFECFFSDILRAWMLSYPNSISRRQLTGEDILALPDKAAIVNALVEKALKDVFYDRPANWFEKLEELVKIGIPSKADQESFAEVKATRDVLVHGQGIASAYYVEKAGKAARVRLGEPLDVTDPYHQNCWSLIYRLTKEIGDAVAAKATD